MANTLVTVIMPMYNAAAYVHEAIASCLAQTHEQWELIIVDDASTDESSEIVRGVGDPRVTLVRLFRNVGPGAARNIALRHAKGEWITVLDADDLYLSNRISSLLAYASVDGAECLFLDQVDRTQKSINRISLEDLQGPEHSFTQPPERTTLAEWLAGDHVGQPFFHASTVIDGRVRYPEARAAEDTAFLVRLVQLNDLGIVITPEPTYIYRRTPKSLSVPTLAATREREQVYNELLNEFSTPRDLQVAIRSRRDTARQRREWLTLRRAVAEKRALRAGMLLAASPRLALESVRRVSLATGRRFSRSG